MNQIAIPKFKPLDTINEEKLQMPTAVAKAYGIGSGAVFGTSVFNY